MEWIDKFLDSEPQGEPRASLWILSSIDSLIQGASLTYEQREAYERMDFESMPLSEVMKEIRYLEENQLDKIAYGFKYTQTDIKNHIKKIL